MASRAAQAHPTRTRWWNSAGFDLLQFALFVAVVVWLPLRGAQSMAYNWQWYRVPRYLARVIDGEVIWGPLLKGLAVTVEISLWATALAVAIGLATAMLRLSRSYSGRWLAIFYVEAIRNTPLLVQLYVFYFILAPILGLPRLWTGIVALAAFEGAFAAEIMRAGILSIGRGQWDAAAALGLTRGRAYRLVVLPQAIRLMLPPLAGVLVSLVKHSAIVSVIAVFDLTNEARNVISDTFMSFEIWFTVAAIYLAITVSLSACVGVLERRLAAAR
ncbi:MAG: amino acid ABC transporter permease [Alphaproteobacteria bacterium]|nr:amino acid ABC transporter permease [Alphaproteobacteria bacterium]